MKKFYPVIHCSGFHQTMLNAEYVAESGADGVFLINMEMHAKELEPILTKVKTEFPDMFVGVNYLGVSIMNAINYRIYDAIWFDDVGYEARVLRQISALCDRVRDVYKTKIYGGYDFKYRKPVENIIKATLDLNPIVDVLTTSGKATGVPADIQKMIDINSIARKPIAIASGITLKNIENYLPYVDHFLVNTGISESFEYLDPDKVEAMASIINKYNEKHYD